MKNRTWIALAAAAALWSGAAQSTLKNVENAYETDAGHVLLPSSASGQVVIRQCAGCKPVVLRVNQATSYFVGAPSAPVSLDVLRKAAGADGADKRLLTVFYNLDSKFVTRIVLSAGN